MNGNLWILTMTLAAAALRAGPVFPPGQTQADIGQIVNFLTSIGDVTGPGSVGLSYRATNNDPAVYPPITNAILPLSFYSSPQYWFQYVGQQSSELLAVVDNFNSNDFTLLPPVCSSSTSFPTYLCPGNLQLERTLAYMGTNIYDAAVWQISLALAGKDGFTGPGSTSLFSILNNQTYLLSLGCYGNQPNASSHNTSSTLNALRATTNHAPNPAFLYGGKSIYNPQNAYFFRGIPPAFINADPLYYSPGVTNAFITGSNIPLPPTDYYLGSTTWDDFKPITGENAWAFLIGPLQSALIQQQSLGTNYVPFNSIAVQNAINVLLAFQYMQSPIGGIYYSAGTVGNEGETVSRSTVSLENNFSVLGGLFILKKILNAELANETDLTPTNINQINTALAAIQTLIYGDSFTKGILSFMQNYGFDHAGGIFYQGGSANDPNQPSVWVPVLEPKSVDVNTWGVACLGQPLIDSWFGFGTAYNIWQKVKDFGGFYVNGTLWGVGYSDQDGNGYNPNNPNTPCGILSGEWSAGAINMVRVLITQYGNVVNDTEHYIVDQRQQAAAFVASLQADQDSMLTNILSVRTDNYPSNASVYTYMPPNYNQLMYGGSPPPGKLAFLYASKRYTIPFGWIANPIPSTASTTWMVFLYYNFNPFNPLGTYETIPELNAIPPALSNQQKIYDVSRIKQIQQEKITQIRGLFQ
jgi:hypothetical protein